MWTIRNKKRNQILAITTKEKEILQNLLNKIKIGNTSHKIKIAQRIILYIERHLDKYYEEYTLQGWFKRFSDEKNKILQYIFGLEESHIKIKYYNRGASSCFYIFHPLKYKEGEYHLNFENYHVWFIHLTFNLEKNNEHIYLIYSRRYDSGLEKTIYFKNNPDEVMKIYNDLIRKYKEFDKDVDKLKEYFDKTYLPKFKE